MPRVININDPEQYNYAFAQARMMARFLNSVGFVPVVAGDVVDCALVQSMDHDMQGFPRAFYVPEDEAWVVYTPTTGHFHRVNDKEI